MVKERAQGARSCQGDLVLGNYRGQIAENGF